MTKKPRFRPTKKQYDAALLALGLSDRCSEVYKQALVTEIKNHRQTLRINTYYVAGFTVMALGIMIIRAIYGV